MNRRSVLRATAAALAATGTAVARQFVETPSGATLFCRDWGKGKPVVFIHGWAMHSDMWQYQMVHLASHGLRAVAYDRRGHGRSSDPGIGYDFDTLAGDLAALLQELDLRQVTLVSHSMGAGEIVRYLTRHGAGRIERVVLVAPTLPFVMKTASNPHGVDRNVLEQIRGMYAADFPKWLADNAAPFFTPQTSPQTIQWGIAMCQAASLRAVIECHRSLTETDFRGELAIVKVPMLLIHGDRDQSAPLDFTARRTASMVKGSRLEIYEGAPHGLFATHVERLNRDLLAFVRQSG